MYRQRNCISGKNRRKGSGEDGEQGERNKDEIASPKRPILELVLALS